MGKPSQSAGFRPADWPPAPLPLNLMGLELSSAQFEKIRRLVHQLSGINLKNGKEALVRARLLKRLRALKLSDFKSYIDFIESDDGTAEIQQMIDVITTNKTNFFREPAHFDFLRTHVFPCFPQHRLRLWVAACSSGEEAYSLAMILAESLPGYPQRDAKILATDISRRMLAKAMAAEYGADQIKDVNPLWLQKYFVKHTDQALPRYRIQNRLRDLVTVGWLNLTGVWPMKGPFEVIFCRNVMIYFDRNTQQRLIQRFHQLLSAGGFLFVGHSEGLSAITHDFQYVGPAIYQKK